jgi:hypothetical protein
MQATDLRQFILQHLESADLDRLMLNAHRFPHIDVPFAVLQIKLLQKLHTKVPSWSGSDLIFPDPTCLEQASSEVAARHKAGLIGGTRMADLGGGLGVDTWAFSFAFREVIYVEPDPGRFNAALHNFEALGRTNIACLQADAAAFLEQQPTDAFDLIYVDPARRDARNRRVVSLGDCAPDVTRLLDPLLRSAPKVLLKTAPMLDIRHTLLLLQKVTAVWVVSVHNEVREVLYLIGRQLTDPDQVSIAAVEAADPLAHPFAFRYAEEQLTTSAYSPPATWLYDPSPALLKAGAFKCAGARFGLSKLHPNTHLYTSDAPIDGFPGRRFRVYGVVKNDRKAVREAIAEDRAHVAVRHFPIAAADVRKVLQLKEGGIWHLFAVTLADNTKRILITRAE